MLKEAVFAVKLEALMAEAETTHRPAGWHEFMCEIRLAPVRGVSITAGSGQR